MMKRTVVLLALLALVTVPGCRKQKPVDIPPPPPPVSEPAQPAPSQAPTEVAESFPTERAEVREVTDPSIEELNRQGVLQTVYFGYDQDELGDEARSTLQANAQWLKSHARYVVRIEGHADERGSIKYNLSLGDRRADSVRTYLTSLGIEASRLETVSYGEERPAVPGSGEEAWSKNRRAEFVIVR